MPGVYPTPSAFQALTSRDSLDTRLSHQSASAQTLDRRGFYKRELTVGTSQGFLLTTMSKASKSMWHKEIGRVTTVTSSENFCLLPAIILYTTHIRNDNHCCFPLGTASGAKMLGMADHNELSPEETRWYQERLSNISSERFEREYPMSFEEAFVGASEDVHEHWRRYFEARDQRTQVKLDLKLESRRSEMPGVFGHMDGDGI